MITTRLCALCDRKIPDTWIVCKEHYPDYQESKDEEWFKMLAATARRQFEQDNIENLMGKVFRTKKKRLTDDEKRAIRFLRFKGLGYRNIAKVLGISQETIRSYLDRSSPKSKKSQMARGKKVTN